MISSLAFIPCLFAEDNSCWLTAPPQDDVWVIVYDADGDGNRGKIIWQGKIDAGQEIEITSTDGHIRYDFKRDKDQPFEGDIDAVCYQKREILVD
jgi:hypothetical protein